MLFSRWGAFVYRFRRPVAVIALVLGLARPAARRPDVGRVELRRLAGPRRGVVDVADRLAAEFGTGRSNLIVLYRSTDGADVTSPAVQESIAASLAEIREDERVTGIVGYAETGDERFVSADGAATYVVVELTLSNEESVAAVDPLREKIEHEPTA